MERLLNGTHLLTLHTGQSRVCWITSDTEIFLTLNQHPVYMCTEPVLVTPAAQRQEAAFQECCAEREQGKHRDSHLWFSHWLCCNPGHRCSRLSQFNFFSCTATGCWHHNPQIYFTKAVGEVLIRNPCESIHFHRAPPCGAQPTSKPLEWTKMAPAEPTQNVTGWQGAPFSPERELKCSAWVSPTRHAEGYWGYWGGCQSSGSNLPE